MIDLSHPYDSTTIYWPTEKGFEFRKGFEGMTPAGYYYAANSFCSPEHGGTHIDAPIHFHENRNTVDKIPLEQLIAPGLVVDVSEKCKVNRDYLVQVEDFTAWEKRNGLFVSNAIVLIRTGFGEYWPNRREYLGTDERGPEAVAKLHFPGLHPDAAHWLVNVRKIKAVGIDTPSIDYGQSKDFKSHVTLFAQNVPALENVANLDQLPEKGFTIIALPMKIAGGSGGPVRIVALMNQ
jgi:kynurenine formamidase